MEEENNMNWKRWKIGVVVSLVLSLFVAGAGMTAGANWKVFIATFCAAALTHFGSFVNEHPVEKITFGKEEEDPNK